MSLSRWLLFLFSFSLIFFFFADMGIVIAQVSKYEYQNKRMNERRFEAKTKICDEIWLQLWYDGNNVHGWYDAITNSSKNILIGMWMVCYAYAECAKRWMA